MGMDSRPGAGSLPYSPHSPMAVFIFYWPDWAGTWALAGCLALVFGAGQQNRSRHFDSADSSFAYPLREDSVSNMDLVAIALGMPSVLAVAVNAVLAWFRPGWAWALDLHHFTLGLFQSTMLSQLCSLVLKIAVGRLRTSAFARLAEDPESAEALQSFPSGHATMAFSGMVYLSLYMSGKCGTFSKFGLTMRRNKADAFAGSFAVSIGTVVLPLAVAVIIMASRLVDYAHHFSDVNAGAMVGTVASLLAYQANFCALGDEHCDKARPLARFKEINPASVSPLGDVQASS